MGCVVSLVVLCAACRKGEEPCAQAPKEPGPAAGAAAASGGGTAVEGDGGSAPAGVAAGGRGAGTGAGTAVAAGAGGVGGPGSSPAGEGTGDVPVADEKPADPAVVLAGMSAEEKAVLELLGWGGGTHLGVALLWPERWSQAMSGIEALFPKIPIDWGTVRKLIKGAEPLPLVLAAFAEADWDWKAEAPLANWDRARPLVLAFGATDPGLDRPLVPVKEAIGMGMKSAGLSHRLVVPAKDAAALVGELRAILEKMGLADAPELAGLLGVKDGAVLSNGSKAVVVVQGTGFVRIEIVRDEPRDREPDGAGIALARAAVGAAPESVELTPAVFDMVHGGYAVSALVRVERFGRMYLQNTNQIIWRALGNADAESRERIGVAGASEVLQGYALMAPEAAMHDQVSVGLSFAEHTFRGRIVADLTALGASAVGAGLKSTPAFGVQVEGKPLGSASVLLNLRAAASVARLPAILKPREGNRPGLQHLAELVRNGGSLCYLYFALDGGLALLAAMARSGPIFDVMDPAVLLPVGLSANVLEIGPGGVKGVLALAYPARTDADEALRVIGPHLRDLAADVSLAVVESEGFHWLVASGGGAVGLAGKGGDPAEGAGISRVAVDLPALLVGFVGGSRELNALGPVLGRIEGVSRRAGLALVSDLRVVLPGAAADAAVARELPPPLPARPVRQSPAQVRECEEALILEAIPFLSAMSQASREDLAAIGATGLGRMRELSACASGKPELQQAAAELIALLAGKIEALSKPPAPVAPASDGEPAGAAAELAEPR